MSGELNTESQDQEQQQEQEEVVLSPVEQKAVEMGWRPKTEFHGNEEDFVDAKEFVARKPLFDKIEQQSKQLKQLTKGLTEFKEHYNKLEETAIKKARRELEAMRKEAITNADGDTFEKVENQLKQMDVQLDNLNKQKETPVVEPEIAPEFVEWTKKNTWYSKEQDMRDFADDYGITLAKRGVPPDQVLKRVEEMVRKEFAHKFTNPKKEAAPAMETNKGGSSNSSKKETEIPLSDVERKVMNDFLRMKNPDGTPFMTKEQYLKDLKNVKGLA